MASVLLLLLLDLGGILLLCLFLLSGGVWFEEQHDTTCGGSIIQTFWASLTTACGWDWWASLQGAERCSHPTSAPCLFSGCVLCPPGSKQKWERIPSQSVWKMTHWIIFCISNITLAFLPMYQYSQDLPPAASLLCLYLYLLRNVSVNTFTLSFCLFVCFIFFSHSLFFFSPNRHWKTKTATHPRVQLGMSLVTVILPSSRTCRNCSKWLCGTGQLMTCLSLRKEKAVQLRYVLTQRESKQV